MITTNYNCNVSAKHSTNFGHKGKFFNAIKKDANNIGEVFEKAETPKVIEEFKQKFNKEVMDEDLSVVARKTVDKIKGLFS